jgi:hypothetical protein
MKAILDTNLIYYWSKISSSKYCPDKMDNEFSKIDSIVIPSWVLIEILTTSNLKLDQKKDIFEFLSTKGIPFNLTDNSQLQFLPANLLELFDSRAIDGLISQAHDYKFQSEIKVLNLIIKLTTLFLCEYFANESDLIENKKEKLFQNIDSLISGNADYINGQIDLLLTTFYKDDDEITFKNGIENIIYSLFYVASINYNLVKNDSNIIVYLKSVELDEDAKTNFLHDLSMESLHKKILKRINNKSKRSNLISNSELFNKTFNLIEEELKSCIQEGLLKYYLEFVRKILTESSKLSKNDTIDSFLMAFYPDYLILTADTNFGKIIKAIDNNYWKDIELILKTIEN